MFQSERFQGGQKGEISNHNLIKKDFWVGRAFDSKFSDRQYLWWADWTMLINYDCPEQLCQLRIKFEKIFPLCLHSKVQGQPNNPCWEAKEDGKAHVCHQKPYKQPNAVGAFQVPWALLMSKQSDNAFLVRSWEWGLCILVSNWSEISHVSDSYQSRQSVKPKRCQHGTQVPLVVLLVYIFSLVAKPRPIWWPLEGSSYGIQVTVCLLLICEITSVRHYFIKIPGLLAME